MQTAALSAAMEPSVYLQTVTINHSVDATTTVAITADVDGSGDEDITINAGDTGSSTIAGTTVTLSSGGTAQMWFILIILTTQAVLPTMIHFQPRF